MPTTRTLDLEMEFRDAEIVNFVGKMRVDYSPTDETVVLSCTEGFDLKTRNEISACVEQIVSDIRAVTKGRAIYLVIDYANLKFNLAENDFLRAETERMMRGANIITIVRFGADSLLRAAARTRAMKMHAPSHLYTTLEEARDVVAGLRRGAITGSRSTS
jgi:hypothetical protein